MSRALHLAIPRSLRALTLVLAAFSTCAGKLEKELPASATPQEHEVAESCDKGDMEACVGLARKYHQGFGLKQLDRDEARAVALYTEVCDADTLRKPPSADIVSAGCAGLKQIATTARSRGTPADFDLAEGILKARCADGDDDACNVTKRWGQSLCDSDPERAVRLMGRSCPGPEAARLKWAASAEITGLADACDEGNLTACLGLAEAWHDGKIPKDIPTMAHDEELAKRACEGGIAQACQQYATWRSPRARAEALNYHEKACQGGVAAGCIDAAALCVDTRTGLATDVARSARNLGKACDLGSALACLDLAGLYRRGDGLPADPNHAKELADKACAMGECLGPLEKIAPTGTAANLIAAARACDRQVPEGCHTLATWVRSSPPAETASARAMPLFERGCAEGKGVADACFQEATWRWYHPKGVDDQEAAFLRLVDVCDGVNAAWCLDLGLAAAAQRDEEFAFRLLAAVCTSKGAYEASGPTADPTTRARVRAAVGRSCDWAAVALRNDRAMDGMSAEDRATMAGIYAERACELDVAAACAPASPSP